MIRIYDENGRLKSVKKEGETVWTDENYIQRPKIGDKTSQILREAETVQDIKEYLARIHNIDLNPETSKE